MRVALILVGALALGGCSNDVCANVQGTCVALHIDGNGSVATVEIDATFSNGNPSGGTNMATSMATGDVTSLPLVMPVRFHSGISGATLLAVTASVGGNPVGFGMTTVQVIDGQHTTGAVILENTGGKSDAGVNAPDFGAGGAGGTGGSGGIPGGGCTVDSMCSAGFYCNAGNCQPAQQVPPGSKCTPGNSAVQCGGGTTCAPDLVCRFQCASTTDCTAQRPMSKCETNLGPQGYCSVSCDPMGGGGCQQGTSCVVIDFTNQVSDCKVPDGKNLPPGGACNPNVDDCSNGESCYVKAGQDMGTCWNNCSGPGTTCTSATGMTNGQCQGPVGSHFDICCPSGMSCL